MLEPLLGPRVDTTPSTHILVEVLMRHLSAVLVLEWMLLNRWLSLGKYPIDPAGSVSWGRSESCVIADADEANPDLVEDVALPPDLPLEMIAEEVKNSWRLKVCLSSYPASAFLFCRHAVMLISDGHPDAMLILAPACTAQLLNLVFAWKVSCLLAVDKTARKQSCQHLCGGKDHAL